MAAQASTPPLNRAPAARQAASNASVSAGPSKSTVRKSPLLVTPASSTGSGKVGHSPRVSCANSIQS
ncbi:Uncharacterised protein [Mycobacterium tuberculosis]|nr:Uncharacterised protein [Mycobacterium tuberculosis]